MNGQKQKESKLPYRELVFSYLKSRGIFFCDILLADRRMLEVNNMRLMRVILRRYKHTICSYIVFANLCIMGILIGSIEFNCIKATELSIIATLAIAEFILIKLGNLEEDF